LFSTNCTSYAELKHELPKLAIFLLHHFSNAKAYTGVPLVVFDLFVHMRPKQSMAEESSN
jgi:hypothetical protein